MCFSAFFGMNKRLIFSALLSVAMPFGARAGTMSLFPDSGTFKVGIL